jgi:hypothetical protein
MSLDVPLPGSDSTRFSASIDGRNELWDFHGTEFSVRRVDMTLGLASVSGSRALWTSSVTGGTRRVSYRASLHYDVVRWPEQRLVLSGAIRTEIGRNQSSRFAKGEPSLRLHWLPKARGSDFETSIELRAGRGSGATPVDELFILGLDRDTDLLLRAHSSLSNGRRGAGPIGNRYVLMNAQTAKLIRDFGIARISAGPFVDVARMSDVFVDAGLFLNLSVGRTLTVSFSVARDFRSGHIVGFFN